MDHPTKDQAGGQTADWFRCVRDNRRLVVEPSELTPQLPADERPLDMTYYELLGLPATCTTEEVKKAYRRLVSFPRPAQLPSRMRRSPPTLQAIKHHPDKNPDDPEAADRFKEIAIAYTTLSDPGLRHSYNEFGKGKGNGQDADSMVDPEAIFSQLFGGERFQDIIGTISLGSEMKSAMQDDDEEEEPAKSSTVVQKGPDGKPILSPEEIEAAKKKKEAKEAAEKKVADQKAKVREERVQMLVERLRSKLALFTEQAQSEEDEQIANGGESKRIMPRDLARQCR